MYLRAQSVRQSVVDCGATVASKFRILTIRDTLVLEAGILESCMPEGIQAWSLYGLLDSGCLVACGDLGYDFCGGA